HLRKMYSSYTFQIDYLKIFTVLIATISVCLRKLIDALAEVIEFLVKKLLEQIQFDATKATTVE
ncbi:MAG: hypothetical protein MJE68_11295, partial [Proteobacteria bacterium]|nr:hypothetical protein [Pseudomonadota bacterium]